MRSLEKCWTWTKPEPRTSIASCTSRTMRCTRRSAPLRRRLATVLYCCNFLSAKAKVKECYGSLDLWFLDEKADDVPQAAGSAGFRTPLTWI